MVSRPHRTVVMLVLVCYFTSKIIVAYNKLREGRVGTVFNTVSTDIIEVIIAADFGCNLQIGDQVNRWKL